MKRNESEEIVRTRGQGKNISKEGTLTWCRGKEMKNEEKTEKPGHENNAGFISDKPNSIQ